MEHKKRKWVFPVIFLAIQAIFLAWLIGGVTSAQSEPTAYEDAQDAGTAIGAMLVISLWVATDIILGFTWLVFKLTRRH